ncbi:Fe(3+) ABC transporter substrate-binding protein [Achromobacter sp. GG226]|uniref:Fe(3+) ABC transporter substrate-binding protein n=1 Tax=Verticiella alkaliphila TaxID=2779529 RepID=UPI001C0DF4F1|nr:Fe(3+) ABC transporter substrate-binding protein [Verticiella sp. GG226]MBU4610234.1 Fe(3+) ABC transporter substrate-binding protein [Verticiella sp. GG226]
MALPSFAPLALRRAVLGAACFFAVAGTAAAAEVNLYTTREPGLIQPLNEAFTQKTGIKVNMITLKDGLAERVAAEGERSPADVLMTVDFGNLVDLVEQKVTQPVTSETLNAAIPANLRDPQGEWFALSLRSRVLYADNDLKLTNFTYEELADPKWKGKLCIRSGQHPYNISLISAYIAHHGEAKTEEWLRGMKANLARKAAGGDRNGARDILGGICDIAVANAYYAGQMKSGKSGDEQKTWGDAFKVVQPVFEKGGTHVNVSGAAVARHAPNKTAAVQYLEYLVSDEAQGIYAAANYEYPVKPGAPVDPLLQSFGELKVDNLSLKDIASHRRQASQLVDKVGFDD